MPCTAQRFPAGPEFAEGPVHRSVDPLADPAEFAEEARLRPRRLDEFVGQPELTEHLQIVIEAARKRGQAVDHLLFVGPPGLGKTSLSGIVAAEMGVGLRITSGPALVRTGDLAALLTDLQPGDVLFIDEVHRLPRPVEEVLYPAMEDFQLDLLVGKGPTARSIRLDLPRFTLIGATTQDRSARRARFATASVSWRASTSTARTTFRRSSHVRPGSSGSRPTSAAPGEIAERSGALPGSPTACSGE